MVQSGRILPDDEPASKYWADEVRVTRRYLYASTRGLEPSTKGYVTVWAIDDQGLVRQDAAPLTRWQTPTSGGWANAVEPAPCLAGDDTDEELLALTDSEEGYVFVLVFDGKQVNEVARLMLPEGKAATAVWLS